MAYRGGKHNGISQKMFNNNFIPALGLGTLKLENFDEVIPHAVRKGFKLFDTSPSYFNQRNIGFTFKKLLSNKEIDREDIFITTKYVHSGPLIPTRSLEASLKDLQMDYVDLLLIEWPSVFPEKGANEIQQTPLYVIWEDMEKAVRSGKAKQIGVSNFGCQMIIDLLTYSDIKPSVNQVEFHPYFQRLPFVSFLQNLGIVVQGYNPLGLGNYQDMKPPADLCLLEDPVIFNLANKYGVTPAQIILNFSLYHGLSVIPKTSTLSRIDENFEATSFQMEFEDYISIEKLDKGLRILNPMNSNAMGNIPIFE